jgi:hypothetical protein
MAFSLFGDPNLAAARSSRRAMHDAARPGVEWFSDETGLDKTALDETVM